MLFHLRVYFVVNPAGCVGLRNHMVQYLANFYSHLINLSFFKHAQANKRKVIYNFFLFIPCVFLQSVFLKTNKMHQLRYNKIHRQTRSYQVPNPTCFGPKVPSSGSFSATSFRRSNLFVFKKYEIWSVWTLILRTFIVIHCHVWRVVAVREVCYVFANGLHASRNCRPVKHLINLPPPNIHPYEDEQCRLVLHAVLTVDYLQQHWHYTQ